MLSSLGSLSPLTLLILLLNLTFTHAALASNPGDYNVIPCGNNKGKTQDCTARISNREASDLRALRLRLQLFIRANEPHKGLGVSDPFIGRTEGGGVPIDGDGRRDSPLIRDEEWAAERGSMAEVEEGEKYPPRRRGGGVVLQGRRDLRRSRAVLGGRRGRVLERTQEDAAGSRENELWFLDGVS